MAAMQLCFCLALLLLALKSLSVVMVELIWLERVLDDANLGLLSGETERKEKVADYGWMLAGRIMVAVTGVIFSFGRAPLLCYFNAALSQWRADDHNASPVFIRKRASSEN